MNPCPLCGEDMDECGPGELDCEDCDQSCCERCMTDGRCPDCDASAQLDDELDDEDDELIDDGDD